MTSHSILFIYKEEFFREIITLDLTNEGYEVTSAETGKEALRKIKKSKFDLVITELKAAGLDGLEILKAAKQVRPETMVILLANNESAAERQEAVKNGVEDFLKNPCNKVELFKKVDECFKKKSAEKKAKEKKAAEKSTSNKSASEKKSSSSQEDENRKKRKCQQTDQRTETKRRSPSKNHRKTGGEVKKRLSGSGKNE